MLECSLLVPLKSTVTKAGTRSLYNLVDLHLIDLFVANKIDELAVSYKIHWKYCGSSPIASVRRSLIYQHIEASYSSYHRLGSTLAGAPTIIALNPTIHEPHLEYSQMPYHRRPEP